MGCVLAGPGRRVGPTRSPSPGPRPPTAAHPPSTSSGSRPPAEARPRSNASTPRPPPSPSATSRPERTPSTCEPRTQLAAANGRKPRSPSRETRAAQPCRPANRLHETAAKISNAVHMAATTARLSVWHAARPGHLWRSATPRKRLAPEIGVSYAWGGTSAQRLVATLVGTTDAQLQRR